MQILAWVPWRGASNDSEVIENMDFQGFRMLRLYGTLGNEVNIIIYVVLFTL